MSDPAILHDHPWSYASLILKNGYYEHTQDGKRFYGVGSLLFRDGSIPHKLEVVEGKPSLSLIVTTKPWRQWGFQSKEGWKPFTEVEY